MASKPDTLAISANTQGNFYCEWTIQNFSSINSQVGRVRQSNWVSLAPESRQWRISLYPGGETQDSNGHISCYVERDVEDTVTFKFQFLLRNTKGETLFNSDYEWIGVSQLRNGFPKTIEAKNAIPKLENDVLVVVLDATYCSTRVKDNINVYRYNEIPPVLKLIEDWQNLWITKDGTDFVISTGGQDFPAHSLVLGVRSKVFAAMFTHDTLEKKTRRVEIIDFEKDTMQSFLEFIYCGSVRKMDPDLAFELIRASDKYEVSDLNLYCNNYIASLLNDDNVCQMLVKADIYNAQKVRSQAITYLCTKKSAAFSEVHHPLFNDRPQLLFDIIKKLFQ